MEELFKNHTPNEILTHFINKWAARGFIAWIISAILWKFSPLDFAITLGIMFICVSWLIKAEWRQYKRWLKSQEKKKKLG